MFVVEIISHLNDFNYKQADCYYLVASLFALHQISWQGDEKFDYKRNLGASFAKLQASSDGNESTEKRFVALLNSHQEDLANHLRHAVSLLKSKEIGIDWLQLLKDLQRWDNDDRRVQRDWAKAFWSSTSDEPENKTETNQSENQLETKSTN